MQNPPPIEWPKNPARAPVSWQPHCHREEPLHPVQIAAFKRMSPAQKLDLIVAMYRTGLALRSAGLKMRHPAWSDERVDLEARRGLLHART